MVVGGVVVFSAELGVPLQGELVVGLGNVGQAGVPVDFEHFVIIHY